MKGTTLMTCNEIISQLQAMSSEKHKANVIKLGIPEENSIGVSTTEIRALAKKLKNLRIWHMNCGNPAITKPGCWQCCSSTKRKQPSKKWIL